MNKLATMFTYDPKLNEQPLRKRPVGIKEIKEAFSHSRQINDNKSPNFRF